MIVTLLIPVHNRILITMDGLANILDIISSHCSKFKVNYKVVVIDDGSTDGTYSYIETNYPSIHLLKGDGNLWWSGAINVGAKYAIEKLESDYILLWNDDVTPALDYFQNLDTYLRNINDNSVITGSLVLAEGSNKVWFNGAYYNKTFGFARHIQSLNNKNKKINCLTGMGTLIPASIVQKLNYWDNVNFPQYWGDIDFTLRAFDVGMKLCVNQKLLLYNHTQYSSFNQNFLIKNYCKSLKSTQSRYNICIESKFHKKHCKTFFWVFTATIKHTIYLMKNIINTVIS